jgi:hypothetical protein
MTYCLNDTSQKLSKLLNSEIKVAHSHANDAMIAFKNERFDEVKELWKKCYDGGYKGLVQSATREETAYCINFVIASKIAFEMFDRENKTFVEFQHLGLKRKKSIAEDIKNSIEHFKKHLENIETWHGAFMKQVKIDVLYNSIF